MNLVKRRKVNVVFKAHQDEIMSQPGVAGFYVGRTQPTLVVMLEKADKKLERSLPRALEGYPVMVEVTGKLKAF